MFWLLNALCKGDTGVGRLSKVIQFIFSSNFVYAISIAACFI